MPRGEVQLDSSLDYLFISGHHFSGADVEFEKFPFISFHCFEAADAKAGEDISGDAQVTRKITEKQDEDSYLVCSSDAPCPECVCHPLSQRISEIHQGYLELFRASDSVRDRVLH